MDLQDIIPSKIYEVIDRAGISTVKQILTLSIYDIKKVTNLHSEDVILLKNIVSEHLCPQSITCDRLRYQNEKISTGCAGLDKFLKGGFRSGTVTEIYGESSSGKTQIALQAAVYNWSSGAVFICTEDLFPAKRYDQIKKGLSNYNSNCDYGKNIFVEHITEASDLIACLRVRLPKLLEKNNPNLIILDSITGPFRCEYNNYMQRAEELREVAMVLINIAQRHNLAVLCLNQVTAAFDGLNNVLPSLGLAWSNMISTRLWLKKTNTTLNVASEKHRNTFQNQTFILRELSIIFAPDLANLIVKLIITPTGIQTI